ncbi:MAG: SDR family NAD(P)-dependent oxidoreductase, partial [Pirellula sp.]
MSSNLMDLQLSNHVAVVTGGASGIGLATAHRFAAEGAQVAIWDLDPMVLQQAQEIQGRYGVRTLGVRVDVSSES